jgi:hypothetical protein
MVETESIAAIRARLIEIEAELFAPGSYTRSNVASPNCDELNRLHEQRIGALGRERVDLLSKLPPTGEASGQRIIFAKVLGDIADWPPPEPEVHVVRDAWDWSEDA